MIPAPDPMPALVPRSEDELAALLDEVIEARRAGQTIDRADLLRRFPELAGVLHALDDLGQPSPPVASASSGPTTPLPERIGPYQVRRELGTGGFGTIYHAHDPGLQREVALKVLHPRWLDQPEAVARFLVEAQAIARLRHRGIVQLYDFSRTGPPYYLVTELVDGIDPCTWCRLRQATPDEIAELMALIGEAVEAAHEQGIAHRDLKPANILVDRQGQPHVLDFGLARFEPGPDAPTRPPTSDGRILGTLAYMAPEQAAGHSHRADARSDVYSLGVILYELLTGRLPIEGPLHMLPVRVIEDQPLDPRQHNAAVPRDLEAICLKALAKAPSGRYPSAGGLARDLRRFLAREPVAARPLTWIVRLQRRLDRRHQDTLLHDWSVILLLEGLTILAGCALLSLWELWHVAPAWPYLLTKAVQVALMLYIAVRFRPLREPNLTAAERQIWSLVPAYYGGLAAMGLVNQFLEHPVPLAPFQAILSGVAFVTLGAGIWGWFYVWGFAFFLLAILIACVPPTGMLLLGLGWFVCLVIGSIHLRRVR